MGGVDTAPEMERMTDMRVYADQAATTSLSKTALEAMLPWMTENFGNPSACMKRGGQRGTKSRQRGRKSRICCM